MVACVDVWGQGVHYVWRGLMERKNLKALGTGDPSRGTVGWKGALHMETAMGGRREDGVGGTVSDLGPGERVGSPHLLSRSIIQKGKYRRLSFEN